MQEKDGKLARNRNTKTVRAWSVAEKPVRVSESKKVKDNVMFKDGVRAGQKNANRMPRLGKEE